MSFAVPAAEAVAARAGAASAGAEAASARAGAGAASGRAGAAAGAAAKVPSGTAAQRAQALTDSGASRTKARRALRDEFGATAAQADDLLDSTTPPTPEPTAGDGDAPGSQGSRRPGVSMPSISRSAGQAINAGGGAILGALAYVAFLVYLRGGSAGLKAWYRAKFLNETAGQ